jgi:hypothetical protein
MKRSLVAIFLCLAAGSAIAEDFTGSQLKELCQSYPNDSNANLRGFCVGYIAGITNAWKSAQDIIASDPP